MSKILTPYIAEWAYVPLATLGVRADAVRKKVTVRPRQFNGETVNPIKVYSEKVAGYLGLPIDWAINEFSGLTFEDRTVSGGPCRHTRLPDPHHPRASPGQAEFMEDMLWATQNYFTVFAKAPTGSGKTVVALRTAALLGLRTLIVVPLVRLAKQWTEEIVLHLGVPASDVGLIQGDVCEYDKPFSIAVTKSMAGRNYPAAMYRAFGLVIVDEGHRIGAPSLSSVIGKFPARHHLILTATDKRKDGCEKVYQLYYGPPRIRSTQPALEAKVHSITHTGYVPEWVTMPSHIASTLADDDKRNRLITRILCSLYDKQRHILGIGDSVEHLQLIGDLLIKEGVPGGDIGIYVSKRYTNHTRQKFPKIKNAARLDFVTYWKPQEGEYLFDHQQRVRVLSVVGGGFYFVTSDLTVTNKSKGIEVHIDELRGLPEDVRVLETVPHSELDRISKRCPIILATYGMLKEGIDIPRLDAGMDVTPRSDAIQVIGRIRRPLPGKPLPVWYTIRDVGRQGDHLSLRRWWHARMKEYRANNCTVYEHGELR